MKESLSHISDTNRVIALLWLFSPITAVWEPRYPNHSHNLPLFKPLTQPYHKNIQITNSTLWHPNGLLNPPQISFDMFPQSGFRGHFRSPQLTARCQKSPEIQHYFGSQSFTRDINTTVSTCIVIGAATIKLHTLHFHSAVSENEISHPHTLKLLGREYSFYPLNILCREFNR